MQRAVIEGFQSLLKLALAVFGIICLGSLPGLFNHLTVNVPQYIQTIQDVAAKLAHPASITYSTTVRPLFPEIFIRFKESLIIFSCSLFFSITLAIIVVYYLIRLSERRLNQVRQLIAFFESIPDILIILGLQLFVVWLFQVTGVLFVKVAGIGDNTVRALPMIALSIPTTLMFIKLLLVRFEEEFRRDYVLLAEAKGLSRVAVFYRHVFINVLFSLFFFTKTTIWFMLSNLYIIEYFFNSLGIFLFVKENPTSEIFVVSLLLIYIPVFLFIQAFQLFAPDALKERT
ncbi:ABC transporter permease subunit [Fictibacillus aquaticus]|uniref:Peptide ABC transporter permease n=1 Tax=Fictibacillus aquaticus TaxID=2021314 RepID=A0A235F816_9BACL|nr:ABC transporter permease subunit [Fictibacillus aquaticus]OYD57382.1 peptide ABC transporter permease [Fictibacillus aquaticus]